jgi:hypothetical protein
MTTTLTPANPPLRDALYALSLAKRIPDAELLDDVIRRYPIYAGELTDFAIEVALDALRGDAAADAAEAAIDTTRVSPAVSRAMSHFHNRLHAVRQSTNTSTETLRSSLPTDNPFSRLNRTEFREFAVRLGANTVFVAKLRDRQIEPSTMTPGFQSFVADELRAPLDVVIAHFAMSGGATMVSRQFFKADVKPDVAKRQSFEDAVRNSGLSEEQQQRLLGF